MGTRLKLGTKSAGEGAAEHVRACETRGGGAGEEGRKPRRAKPGLAWCGDDELGEGGGLLEEDRDALALGW